MSGIITLRRCPNCKTEHLDCSKDECDSCSKKSFSKRIMDTTLAAQMEGLDVDKAETELHGDASITMRFWKDVKIDCCTNFEDGVIFKYDLAE